MTDELEELEAEVEQLKTRITFLEQELECSARQHLFDRDAGHIFRDTEYHVSTDPPATQFREYRAVAEIDDAHKIEVFAHRAEKRGYEWSTIQDGDSILFEITGWPEVQ